MSQRIVYGVRYYWQLQSHIALCGSKEEAEKTCSDLRKKGFASARVVPWNAYAQPLKRAG